MEALRLRVSMKVVYPSDFAQTPPNANKAIIISSDCVMSGERKQDLLVSLLLAVLLLDLAELLLDVHIPHLLYTSSIFGRIKLTIVRQCSLLPPSFFLCRYRQSSSAIVDILTLTSKAFEVVRDVGGVDGCRVSGFGLVALFFPARIKQFD